MRATISNACSGALALTLVGGFAARAQMLERPEAAQRVVRVWTFDEPGSGIEPIPPGWFRSQDNAATGRSRPGYPSFNSATLDFDVAVSGDFSMKLPIRGGSAALQLATGVLAAIPDGDYIISTHVRTENLRVARARLSAWLVDERRNVLTQTIARSRLIDTRGGWGTLSASLRGHPDAAWIQIELELIQPEQFAPPVRSDETVLEEDFDGAAWFDDLSVLQAPRLEMTTQSPINLIEAPERPELTTFVRDLTGESLGIEIFVLDLDGREAARHHVSLPMIAQRTIWTPNLPHYGWYRAVMQVTGRSNLVGQRHVDFVWTAPLTSLNGHERRSFGLIAESLPSALHTLLPPLVRAAHIGAVQLAVWRKDTTPHGMPEQMLEIAGAAERLLDQGLDVTFVLAQAPAELANRARVDRENPLPVLAGDDEAWLGDLGDLLTKFGERVSRWQLGGTGSNRPFFRPDLAGEVTITHQRLRRLVPRPRLALPWGADQSMRRDLGPVEAITLTWPVGIPPGWVSSLAPDIPEGVQVRLVIEPIDAALYGSRESAHDLARRCVEAWAAGFRDLAIDSPWSPPSSGGSEALMPSAQLGVFITMAQQLAGRQIVGEFDVADGVRAFILRGEEQGSLIAWNQSAPQERAALRGYLGDEEIRVIDPFGNVTRPSPGADSNYEITIDDMPVFIEGIDVELAQFRSALRIEPSFIPARAERHEVALVIENPWDVSISGRLRFSKPEDWSISPRVVPFNLVAGEISQIPIELSFNLGEEAGPRQVIAQLELLARQRYPMQQIGLGVEIGLPSIELSAGYRLDRSREGGPADIVVTLRIANRTDLPLTLEAFAHAPGYRRDFRPISGLQPGDTTIRFFRFPRGAETLLGKRVRVGVKEQDGTGRLNKTIRIDPRLPAGRPLPEDD